MTKKEYEQLYLEWKEKYKIAKKNMDVRKGNDGVLIEVAAQHPLIDGLYPNEEFTKRLDEAYSLYCRLKDKKKVHIYMPGSIHMDNGISDRVSLSEAGKTYLMRLGVPEEIIFGDEKNRQYKGDDGVYNSSDECFVTCKIFEELDAKELHCVCSPAQAMRKVLSYIQFGYMPNVHTVSCDEMFHNYVDEIFRNIPVLLMDGNGLQGDSDEAEMLRKQRKPE